MVDREDPIGMLRILDDISKKREALVARLEGVPFHYDVIPASEIEGLRTVRQMVLARISQYETELGTLGLTAQDSENQQVKDLNSRHFASMESALDEAFEWKAKFLTESGGGGEEIGEDSEHDSIYYITPSNASLRLRRQSFQDGLGLRGVVQPIAGKIWYITPGKQNEIEREPRVGLYIREAITDGFLNRVRGQSKNDGDYRSTIEVYEEEGKILHVNAKAADIHEGDRINKIFFNRRAE